MKQRRTTCVLLVCIATTAALVAGCAPSVTTSPPAEVTTSVSKAAPTLLTSQPETPQYGGTLTLANVLAMNVFDPVAQGQMMGLPGQLILEQYLGEDWGKGAAGSGEVDWNMNRNPGPDTSAGVLAESWKMPELGTIIFKVRRGVRWAVASNTDASRFMNGREVTADDWVASFSYMMQGPRSPINGVPQIASTATMEKTGQWEVTLRTPVDPLLGWYRLAWGYYFHYLLPPEVIKKYGDMRGWQTVVGTGPFVLSDFVAGSSATLARNPNYWGRDPVGPGQGNQLPYLDGVKILAIPDLSATMAAYRTAKIDQGIGVAAEDARSLLKSAPDLKYRTYVNAFPNVIAMRTDKAELPFKDRRVRQALMMATDFAAIKNDLYGGEAEILAFPTSSDIKSVYVPLENMPESAQVLYRHSPGGAKELLAEAGLRDGVKARMVVTNNPSFVDLASACQAMWATAGIDIEIQTKESGVFNSIVWSRAYEDMLLTPVLSGGAYPGCLNLPSFRGGQSYVNDPVIEAASLEIQKHVIIDMPEADRPYRELMAYIVEQSYYIPLPTPLSYTFWWPWLKNYHGEAPTRLAMYYWIDRDLKEQMTGRR